MFHRRCHRQIENLSTEADALVDDLMAADHAMEEVINACQSLTYALTEADIPEELRERLRQLNEFELAAQDQVETITA